MPTAIIARALRRRAIRVAPPPRGLGSAGLGLPSYSSVMVPGTSYKATLPSVSSQDVVSALPSNLQAQYASAASAYSQSQLAQQGASSALSLVTGGFDPSNPSNAAALVHVYAGAVSLVPGVGPILGGAVEGLYAIGQALANWGPMQQLIGGCHSSDPAGCCQHTGTTTYAQGIGLSHLTSDPGTLSALMVPQFVNAWAGAMNCDRLSLWPLAYSQMLPVLIGLWNSIASGPPVDYYVPYFQSPDSPASLRFAPGGVLPPAFQYSQIGPLAYPVQGPYAFRPMSEIPYGLLFNEAVTPLEGYAYTRITANAGPLKAAPVVKKHLDLHLGPPPSTFTPGQAIGITALGTVAAAAAGGSLYAFFTNQGIGYFWGKIFDQALEGAKGLFGSVGAK